MQKLSPLSLLVAAGGTGGDLFPVVAIIEQLRTMLNDRVVVEATFVGNPDRIEGRFIPERGYRFVAVPMRGYYGLRSARTYSMLWRLPVSLLRVWKAVRRSKPRLAVLAGTYLSVPVAIVARMYRVPIVLVEINAAPGKVNRLLSDWAERILVSFPECRQYFRSQHRVIVTGTPVRAELGSLPESGDARQRFGFERDRPVLLVMGGSLGARSINRAIARYADQIVALGWQVLWQTGRTDEIPASLPAGVVAVPFIEDMATAYAAAELVLCRAGGSTVAELAATRKPAILVPYPHAANREQHKNAAICVEQGAAVMLSDSQLEEELWQHLEPLLGDARRRRAMAEAFGRMAAPDAATTAAGVLAQLVGL